MDSKVVNIAISISFCRKRPEQTNKHNKNTNR
jgi:hypothetical protein